MMKGRTAILLILLALAAIAAGTPLCAQTKEIDARKEKIKGLEADISYLDNQIKSVQKQKVNTMDALVLVQRKITNRKNLLNELDREIKGQTRKIEETRKEIQQLDKRLDTLELYYRKMVYNAYKHRDTRLWFMYILASDDFEQGYRRWSYLKNYSKNIASQASKINELKQERTAQIASLEKLKKSNLEQQKSRESEFRKLTAEEKQSKAYAKSLEKKQAQYKKELSGKKVEAARLAKEVENMIAAEIRRQQEIARRQAELAKKAQDTETPATPKNTLEEKEMQEYAAINKLSGSFSLNKGKLPFPVAEGVIIEQFGEHPHPTLKNVKLPFNNGINISTKAGSNVRAVFDGTVKQVIAIPGYSQCILVQHGQYFTFYCKLAKAAVKVGDTVSTGETIGTLEIQNNTSTLHFELWNGTTKQNPELWLKK